MPYRPSHNPFGTPFIEFDSIDSTNNYALNRVHAGLAQHGFAFFAHEQVAGKGQRGKTWLAEKNSSLIMSLVADPDPLLSNEIFAMSACVAISVSQFFERYAGDATVIKWPNDLYWHDRKAGGILIENIIGKKHTEPISDSSVWKWSIIGIGININQERFPGALQSAVSLRQITGKVYDPTLLAKELCSVIDMNFKKMQEDGLSWLYSDYQRRLYKKDELVKFRKGARTFQATVRGITPEGRLVLEHGVLEEFNHGELEWLIRE